MDDGARIGRFTCNICGAANWSAAAVDDRERNTCRVCRSSIRFRSVVLALSRALFGLDLAVRDFPILKSVRGLGISDSDVYAGPLAERFQYTNTFYHREPWFDLTRPDAAHFGQYDFVIASEVLEHVRAPVEHAFETLARLLKPAGVLILTVPYTLADGTVEHFPPLGETGLAEVGGRTVLVNRDAEGGYQVFDQLAFHGGHGATVEMRLFSEAGLREKLLAAGLSDVWFEPAGKRKFGVVFSNPCSLPVIARRMPFSLCAEGVSEMAGELAAARALLERVRESRWLRLGRRLGLGPDLARGDR